MARGAFRGFGTAVLSLVALQTLVSPGGSGRVGGLVDDLNRLLVRALDPSVPAIPDRSNPALNVGQMTNDLGRAPVATAADYAGRATPRVPIPGTPSAQ